jgi:hypothetical protein
MLCLEFDYLSGAIKLFVLETAFPAFLDLLHIIFHRLSSLLILLSYLFNLLTLFSNLFENNQLPPPGLLQSFLVMLHLLSIGLLRLLNHVTLLPLKMFPITIKFIE